MVVFVLDGAVVIEGEERLESFPNLKADVGVRFIIFVPDGENVFFGTDGQDTADNVALLEVLSNCAK